nr:PREDICTED: exonuclease V, chloroplastic isoform X3 [Musa acuminata subsp. malaccensis]
MSTSAAPSSSSSPSLNVTGIAVPATAKDDVYVPVEIVSEEEMAFLEAALASTRSVLSSSPSPFFSSACSSASRFALLSPLPSGLSHSCRPQSLATTPNIEDFVPPRSSLLRRFRSRRGLSVTDIIGTEWCEKQMEFALTHGKPKRTVAMKAGSDRHSQLEKEVVEKVEIRTESVEEYWVIQLMNFIVGAHQLLFEGLTRELPVLQLMCYKYLWDNLVTTNFPMEEFFDHFKLNRLYILSGDVKEHIASLGFDVKMLEDVFTYFQDTSCMLSLSHEQLLLRYELQSDHSLLGEDSFLYDAGWFQKQIHKCLEFWMGDREASFVSDDEKWKCNFCKFTSICPLSATTSRKSAK